MSNFDFDYGYLKSTVSAPLTEAMAQLAVAQPEDPVDFLGHYLLKYVDNEIEKQQQQERAKQPRSTMRIDPSSYMPPPSNPNDELDQALAQERLLLAHMQQEQSVIELHQRFVEWMASYINAEEAYVGRKVANADGQTFVHWVSSSRSTTVVVDKFVTEEKGITFDVFKEVEDPAAPPDADGNPVPPSIPKYIHVENVLREPRMKYFGIPKLGAFVASGVKYKSYIHQDVFNDANPDEPNGKEEWLVVAADTMGQARSFTQAQLDGFHRSSLAFATTLEELERSLYSKDLERKVVLDDPQLKEFYPTFVAEVALQEENVMLQVQSLPEEEKAVKETELRLSFLTFLLLNNVATLARASARVTPFKTPALAVFAAALCVFGHRRDDLLNPVTKQPSWERIAPWLEEEHLKTVLAGFDSVSPPPTASARLLLGETAKSDVEAASVIGVCLFLWVQAVFAHSERLEAAAELARQRALEEAAAAE
ncbi:TPA: hypothetical protein N0F65_004645 [Lagenidium giganteum]|uniref:Uncharacterized protein n=1 Tax=Lagenidium giganteum TaxID=4803 RepID=A0AAV2Z8U4_9STRA|nr:TPA: hypothetical protein N0F65_004645 [Lagenidium giganteum]